MEKVIEELLKLIPFAAILENWGVSKGVSVIIATAAIGLLLYGLKTGLQLFSNHYKNSKTAQDLSPYFDYQKVKRSRELYIPTRYQNCSPTSEEEPAFSHKFVATELLIPFFIKTAFDEKKESDKFYLVLADSGMGKTTFIINLYVRYNSLFNFRRKYKIRLFPFGDSRIMDQIRQIPPEEARNTILLLDAFDEDKQLIPPSVPDGLNDDERFRRRLDEIIEAVRDFREVVITSRTQYFPGQEDKPYELKIPTFDEKGFHTLAKLYLSPFDSREIKSYLNKKYGLFKFWNYRKKKIAATVVRNSPKLMVRPMLLSYIDYLVEEKHEFTSTKQIYETLVEKWIDREAHKRKPQQVEREKFKQDLRDYSRKVAVAIFRRRKETNMLELKKETAIEIAHTNHLDLQDYEITGQSLLTRDMEGNWKFAHKSILEYFIAKEALENPDFLQEIDFSGLDMAQEFYQAGAEFLFIKGGVFLMGSPGEEDGRKEDETQHQVKVGDFFLAKHTVTLAQFESFISESSYITDADKDGGSYAWSGKEWTKKSGVNWRCDAKGNEQKDKQHPVLHVSWNDAVAYCRWMSEKRKANFRLPTEAEWEYACRAGTATPFNTGENLTTDQANYNGNYPYKKFPKGKYVGKTTLMGSYPANRWGLHDMHGNVWEWCMDWYDEKYYARCKREGVVENPAGPDSGSYRVVRGGGWSNFAVYCRSAYRISVDPGSRDGTRGFRLVFVPQSIGGLSGLTHEESRVVRAPGARRKGRSAKRKA